MQNSWNRFYKYIDFIKLFHHMEKCVGTVKYIDSKLWKNI